MVRARRQILPLEAIWVISLRMATSDIDPNHVAIERERDEHTAEFQYLNALRLAVLL